MHVHVRVHVHVHVSCAMWHAHVHGSCGMWHVHVHPPGLVLDEQVEPFVHRRTAELLRQELPPKYEVALVCRLTEVQARLYSSYLAHKVVQGSAKSLIGSYGHLQQIFNHPSTVYRALAAADSGVRARDASAYDSMDDFLASEDDVSRARRPHASPHSAPSSERQHRPPPLPCSSESCMHLPFLLLPRLRVAERA